MIVQTPVMEIVLCLVWIIFHMAFVSSESEYCIDIGYTPNNGSRSPPANSGLMYFEGSVIRYNCDKNFELKPNEPKQTCTQSKEGKYLSWVPPNQPICVEVQTCPVPAIEHGTPTKNSYHYRDILHVACDDGYENSQTNRSVCLESGAWSSVPKCTERACTDPPPISHGSYHLNYRMIGRLTSWEPGAEIQYQCDNGYALEPPQQATRTCRKGQWSGPDPLCVANGCDPPTVIENGMHYPERNHYDFGEIIVYVCFLRKDNMQRVCQEDHTWSGSSDPCFADTTESMPYTSSGNVYCMRPLPINHGTVLCCSESDASANSSEDPRYCCPVNGIMQFVCDEGYFIEDQATQWRCGPHGLWLYVRSPELGQPTSSPICHSNTTRQDDSTISDDMLKPVLGTAAGVLFILSVAIIIAFCRPKLKDIKRRWREQREDEDELIIDGRRILLPSYEEAVASSSSCNPNYLHLEQPSTSGCNGDTPGPSYTNVYVEDTARQSTTPQRRSLSRDDVSLILQMHPEPPRQPRNSSSSSDEEMLVPASEHGTAPTEVAACSTGHNDHGLSGSRSSLVLSAGTSVESSIVINQSANTNVVPPKQPMHSCDCTSTGAENSKPTSPIRINDSSSIIHDSDLPVESVKDSFSNFDTPQPHSEPDGLLSIKPSGMAAPRVSPHVMSENVHALLTYPLALSPSEDDARDNSPQETLSFTVNLETGEESSEPMPVGESTGTSVNKSVTEADNCGTAALQPDAGPLSQGQRLAVCSNNVHLVTASRSGDGEMPEDLTGSTTV